MLRNRLFNVFIPIALVLVISLTIRESSATTDIVLGGDSTKATTTIKCVSLPSRYSLRTEYLEEADLWIFRTEDGPTGVDGGLIELMSNYRTCSR
jgi:hypothetical protein